MSLSLERKNDNDGNLSDSLMFKVKRFTKIKHITQNYITLLINFL